VVEDAKSLKSLRDQYRSSEMEWTKDDRKVVAETYRELWPGEVTDLEMAMFCKALSWYKSHHVIEGMYLIFSSQANRLRPAAGRVREMALEAKRADPEERAKMPKEEEAKPCSPEELQAMVKHFHETINSSFPAVDDSSL
tara:strand:- start:72 stop:491 length:420 start_codon:yes stop_codon:yes gene_type:complete